MNQPTFKIRIIVSVCLLSSCIMTGCTPPESGTAQGELPPVETPAKTPTNTAELPLTVETAVLEDASSSNNVPIETLTLVSAEPQSWPDGCLGLGSADEICTQAIVEGWEVMVVSQNEGRWRYRTDSEGTTFRRDEGE